MAVKVLHVGGTGQGEVTSSVKNVFSVLIRVTFHPESVMILNPWCLAWKWDYVLIQLVVVAE